MTYQNGRTLSIGFALVAIGTTALVVALLGGGVAELAFALAGGIAVAVVVIGSYVVSSKKGLPHSHSVAIASVMLGVVYMVVVAVRLLTEFGQ